MIFSVGHFLQPGQRSVANKVLRKRLFPLVVKTFRCERYGFKITMPAAWSGSLSGFLGRLVGADWGLNFKTRKEFISIQVVSPTARTDLIEKERLFRDYALHVSHTGLETGTLRAYGIDHLWARYVVGKAVALQMPPSREMIMKTRCACPSELRHLSDEEFIEFLYSGEIGPVVKSYWLIFDQTEYHISCALGIGPVPEVKEQFREKESKYDKIVSTFELIRH